MGRQSGPLALPIFLVLLFCAGLIFAIISLIGPMIQSGYGFKDVLFEIMNNMIVSLGILTLSFILPYSLYGLLRRARTPMWFRRN